MHLTLPNFVYALALWGNIAWVACLALGLFLGDVLAIYGPATKLLKLARGLMLVAFFALWAVLSVFIINHLNENPSPTKAEKPVAVERRTLTPGG